MAAKKDFTKVQTGRVYENIAEATAPDAQDAHEKQRKPRKTYTQAEQEAMLETGQTSGRKGVHVPRINLGFSAPVYDYVRCMSRVSGLSMTQFVNRCLREHMETHKDLYRQALKFRNSL